MDHTVVVFISYHFLYFLKFDMFTVLSSFTHLRLQTLYAFYEDRNNNKCFVCNAKFTRIYLHIRPDTTHIHHRDGGKHSWSFTCHSHTVLFLTWSPARNNILTDLIDDGNHKAMEQNEKIKKYNKTELVFIHSKLWNTIIVKVSYRSHQCLYIPLQFFSYCTSIFIHSLLQNTDPW